MVANLQFPVLNWIFGDSSPQLERKLLFLALASWLAYPALVWGACAGTRSAVPLPAVLQASRPCVRAGDASALTSPYIYRTAIPVQAAEPATAGMRCHRPVAAS